MPLLCRMMETYHYTNIKCKLLETNAKRLCLFAILIFCSCTQHRLIKSMEQFMGQHIIISSDWNAIWNGRDTIMPDLFSEAPIKLIVWYDSLGCASCEVSRMYAWDNITAHAEAFSQWFSIYYLFTPKKEDLHKLRIAINGSIFDYPVFIDQDATFVKQNPNLPKNKQLHSFLLDKNNKVVLVGNPLYNPALWDLYKRTIQSMIINDGELPLKD